MSPYIIAIIAVALIPLALAGIGAHLAVVALPDNPKRRRDMLVLIWGLALVGVITFGILQIVTYKSDRRRDEADQAFRIDVLKKLDEVTMEPQGPKKSQDAVALRSSIATDTAKQSVFSEVAPIGSFPGTVYILPYQPTPSSSIVLYYNGLEQRNGIDYIVSGKRISLKFTTMAGDSIRVAYFHYDK